ncbi:MAG: hypothetical protein ABI369_00720, partial [Acetobacteraceae bacterium]
MAARRPASTPSGAEPALLRVARLGADGDGIGTLPDGTPMYVAGALPGELVRVRAVARRGEGWGAALDAIIEPSAERIVPPCPHFGVCGGCVAQHMGDAAYANWKTARVDAALRRAGCADIPMAALARTKPGGRRRMDLALRRSGAAVVVGLHRMRSRELVDIVACDVL